MHIVFLKKPKGTNCYTVNNVPPIPQTPTSQLSHCEMAIMNHTYVGTCTSMTFAYPDTYGSTGFAFPLNIVFWRAFHICTDASTCWDFSLSSFFLRSAYYS